MQALTFAKRRCNHFLCGFPQSKQQKDEEDKQAKAATDIQRIARGKKDRARAGEKAVVKEQMDNVRPPLRKSTFPRNRRLIVHYY